MAGALVLDCRSTQEALPPCQPMLPYGESVFQVFIEVIAKGIVSSKPRPCIQIELQHEYVALVVLKIRLLVMNKRPRHHAHQGCPWRKRACLRLLSR